MATRSLIKTLFIFAYVLLAGHDFVPHHHVIVHEGHEHAKHHHHDDDHQPQNDGLDVIGLFPHSHGAGQSNNIYFSQTQDQHLKINISQVISTEPASGFVFECVKIYQSDWPEYTCSKAPPEKYAFRPLRAPPIPSFTC